jgi:hypothetical protein
MTVTVQRARLCGFFYATRVDAVRAHQGALYLAIKIASDPL